VRIVTDKHASRLNIRRQPAGTSSRQDARHEITGLPRLRHARRGALLGGSDEELIARVQEHRDQYHNEMTDDQINELVASGAYDE
jgi:hypothetical protein